MMMILGYMLTTADGHNQPRFLSFPTCLILWNSNCKEQKDTNKVAMGTIPRKILEQKYATAPSIA